MIYLDNAATTFQKPREVAAAMMNALKTCSSPGRGGYRSAQNAENRVYHARQMAGSLFDCNPERVVFTANATEALNIALRSLLKQGDRVLISGLEHNAVTRTLTAIGTENVIVTAPLFDEEAWLSAFTDALRESYKAVICTHVSNVYGCVLPIEAIAAQCVRRGIPLVVDASQSAGVLPVGLRRWNAAYVAMPGHKGLFGPQGTGMLLCGADPQPLICGGTGSQSVLQTMPELLPDRLEAGTLNVPGICGLSAGMEWLSRRDPEDLLRRERNMVHAMAEALAGMGLEVFAGKNQAGVLSFRIPGTDPETAAQAFSDRGIALRAGLHCAPLAHQTGGTFPEGTIRLSVSPFTTSEDIQGFIRAARSVKTSIWE